MGERGRSERGTGGGVPMIWVCVRETGERMEQHALSFVEIDCWSGSSFVEIDC